MQMNPEACYQQHEERRRELLRQAKIQRLIQQARQDGPALQQRLLVLLSDLMISGGTRLRRYASDDGHAQGRLQTHDYGVRR